METRRFSIGSVVDDRGSPRLSTPWGPVISTALLVLNSLCRDRLLSVEDSAIFSISNFVQKLHYSMTYTSYSELLSDFIPNFSVVLFRTFRNFQQHVGLPVEQFRFQKKVHQANCNNSFLISFWFNVVFNDNDFFERIIYVKQRG